MRKPYDPIKRALDIASSLVGLLVLSPVFVALAVLVRLKLGSPVFFVQERPGRAEEPFRLVKFRTMTDETGPGGAPLPDEDRLTSFGAWLRRTSMDELPELWNVLKGDMSVVGPRPLLMRYLSVYSSEQARRHEVRPGITGWAQVNGRNALEWADRLRMDVWYVDDCSFALDARILWMTAGQVLTGDGVSAEGHATMPEFRGDDD